MRPIILLATLALAAGPNQGPSLKELLRRKKEQRATEGPTKRYSRSENARHVARGPLFATPARWRLRGAFPEMLRRLLCFCPRPTAVGSFQRLAQVRATLHKI